MFVQQMGRKQQLLKSLQQKPLAPTYILSALQAELTHLDSINTSYKPLILTATQLLRRHPTSMAYHLSTDIPREASYLSKEMLQAGSIEQ